MQTFMPCFRRKGPLEKMASKYKGSLIIGHHFRLLAHNPHGGHGQVLLPDEPLCRELQPFPVAGAPWNRKVGLHQRPVDKKA